MTNDDPGSRAAAAPRDSGLEASLRAGHGVPLAGGGMARSLWCSRPRACLRPWRFRRVRRDRRRPVRLRLGLHPLSRLCRLHGRRTDPRRRSLREESADRRRRAVQPRQHDRRPTGFGRTDPVHRCSPVPPRAALDAGRRHYLRPVLRAAAVFRLARHRGDAVHDADRLGAADRRNCRRRPVSPPSPSPSAPSRSRCCSRNASTRSPRWGPAWRWSGTICRSC